MQLPAFTLPSLSYVETAVSDLEIFEILIKTPYDLVLFFEIACDDELWASQHEDFISKTLSWATREAYEDRLNSNDLTRIAVSIYKHYSELKYLIPVDITVKVQNGEFKENGLLFSASSDYLRRMFLRECRDKKSYELTLNSFDQKEYGPIHSYINTGTSFELLTMGEDDLTLTLKLVLPWQITGFLEIIQSRLSKYLNDDNVVEMTIKSRQNSWFFLAQHCANYLNKKNLGFRLEAPNLERLSFEFYDFQEDALKYFEIFKLFITNIVCKGALPDNPLFGQILKKSSKLISLDISETNAFSQYFENIPKNLTEINLSECPWLSKDTLRKLANICSEIEQMDLTNNTQLKSGVWSELLKFKRLKRLHLSFCHQIQNDDLKLIVNSTKLNDLTLQGCTQITENGFFELAKRQKNLLYLNLSHSSISDNSLLEIAANCKKLDILDVSNCNQITEKGVLNLIKNATALERLNILRCPISVHTIQEIKRLRPSLELLNT